MHECEAVKLYTINIYVRTCAHAMNTHVHYYECCSYGVTVTSKKNIQNSCTIDTVDRLLTDETSYS